MRLVLTLATALMLALCSCSTITHTSEYDHVDTRIVSLTVADMNVHPERIEHTSGWKWKPFNSVSVSREKENATGELLKQVGADVLVEPQYIVKRRGLFRGGSVTVSGYPATYNNFRPMTESDAIIISTFDGKMRCGGAVINTSAPLESKKEQKVRGPKKLWQKVKDMF